jgi:hypothetical protein
MAATIAPRLYAVYGNEDHKERLVKLASFSDRGEAERWAADCWRGTSAAPIGFRATPPTASRPSRSGRRPRPG